jgi:hypothetical protein
MAPEPNPPLVDAQDDAELEWLLCLASALQAREQPAAESHAQRQPPEATLDQELKGSLKELRRPERIRMAS